jgi:DNA-binding MltR family transcriptional regulator
MVDAARAACLACAATRRRVAVGLQAQDIRRVWASLGEDTMARLPFAAPIIELSKETLARIEALKQLDKDSDRALGVTCAAIVDEALAECLRKHFVQVNSDIRSRIDWLMDPGGALSAFGLRIDLGWVLGIYGKAARQEMARIKDIRNDFAHEVSIYSFDDPLIAKRVDQLTLVDKFLTKDEIGWEYHLKLDDDTWIESRGIPSSTVRDSEHPFWDSRRNRYRFTCAMLSQLLGRIPARTHAPLF